MPQKILPVQAVAPQEVAVAGRSVQTSNIISLITNAFDTAASAKLYRYLRWNGRHGGLNNLSKLSSLTNELNNDTITPW